MREPKGGQPDIEDAIRQISLRFLELDPALRQLNDLNTKVVSESNRVSKINHVSTNTELEELRSAPIAEKRLNEIKRYFPIVWREMYELQRTYVDTIRKVIKARISYNGETSLIISACNSYKGSTFVYSEQKREPLMDLCVFLSIFEKRTKRMTDLLERLSSNLRSIIDLVSQFRLFLMGRSEITNVIKSARKEPFLKPDKVKFMLYLNWNLRNCLWL